MLHTFCIYGVLVATYDTAWIGSRVKIYTVYRIYLEAFGFVWKGSAVTANIHSELY